MRVGINRVMRRDMFVILLRKYVMRGHATNALCR
jgi:hypothetical protein